MLGLTCVDVAAVDLRADNGSAVDDGNGVQLNILLEQDVDIRYIQKMLGHSSISTTEIYTHVSNAKQKDILVNKHPRNFMVVNKG